MTVVLRHFAVTGPTAPKEAELKKRLYPKLVLCLLVLGALTVIYVIGYAAVISENQIVTVPTISLDMDSDGWTTFWVTPEMVKLKTAVSHQRQDGGIAIEPVSAELLAQPLHHRTREANLPINSLDGEVSILYKGAWLPLEVPTVTLTRAEAERKGYIKPPPSFK